MDFVASAANLRMQTFHIPRKSRFDIKCKWMYLIMLLFWLQIFSLGWVQLKSMPTVGLRWIATFLCQGIEEMPPQEIFIKCCKAMPNLKLFSGNVFGFRKMFPRTFFYSSCKYFSEAWMVKGFRLKTYIYLKPLGSHKFVPATSGVQFFWIHTTMLYYYPTTSAIETDSFHGLVSL